MHKQGMGPYEGTSTTQQQQRPGSGPPQMSHPTQNQMQPGGPQHHQMGGPYGYPGHRGPQQPPNMGIPPGGPGGFMQGPPVAAQGHRGMPPPNMNMGGHGGQYPGGGQSQAPYSHPNFNGPGGGAGQGQHHPQHQQYPPQQQHGGVGYPPQQHMQQQQQQQQQLGGMPQQGHPGVQPHNSQHPGQQHMGIVQPQQHSRQHPHQQQHPQHQGNYHPQQQQQQPQVQVQQPQQQQGYVQPQQPHYGRQASGASSNPTPTASDGPLSFTNPPNAGSTSGLEPAVAGDYGQQFLPTGLNGDWQSNRDMHDRRDMIQHIVKLLKQKDKNASPEWLTKLPQMVKQLEVSLYRSAPSFEAYADTNTLKHRLQQLAVEIARKTQQAKSEGGNNGDGRKSADAQRGGGGVMSSGNENMRRGSSQGMGPSGQMPQQPLASSNQGMGNSMMGGGNSGGTNSIHGSFNMGSGGGGGSGANDLGGSSHHGNPNDQEWKVRIRHKQQRLLLLHHSSKCPYEDQKCKVTPFCGDMKKLWKHMARCTDNDCRVPHCFSSRSILSHYRKCKDPRCPACGPVRETVRKTQKNSQRRDSSDGGGMMGNFGMPTGGMGSMSNNPFGGHNMALGNNTSGANTGNNNMGGPNIGGPNMGNNMVAPSMGNNNMGGQMGLNGPMDGMMGMDNQMNPPMNGPSSFQQPNQMNNAFPNQNNKGISPMPQWDGTNSNMPLGPQQHGSNNTAGNNNIVPIMNNSNPQMPNAPNQSSQQPIPSDDNNAANQQNGASSSGQNRNESDPSKARHKQQRLLLLRHASKCTHEDGQCPTTTHCAEMKVLWKHIASCKDQYCKVRHCMSSRYVLSHYRRCKDSNCDICGPVRDIIKNGSSSQITVDLNIMAGSGGTNSTTPPMDQSSMPQPKKSKLGTDPSKMNGMNGSPKMGVSSQKSKPDDQAWADCHSSTAPMAPNRASSQNRGASPPPLSSSMIQPSLTTSDNKADAQSVLVAPVGSAPLVVPKKAKTQPESTGPSVVNQVRKDSNPSPKPPPSSTEEHALLECFTTAQIKSHIESLRKTIELPAAKLKTKCLEVLKSLQSHEHAWVFAAPVDPVELGLDDYFDVIKKPMDFQTIGKKIDNGSYHALDDFKSDIILTFTNAMKYNEEKTVVHEMAKEMKNKFDSDYKKLMKELEKEHEENRKNERACTLCGCEKLSFEPPVYFCNGPNCPSKRVRRNTHFYMTPDKQYCWCNQCYNELNGVVDAGATKLKKEDLKKLKNDENHEESWVQCDDCERWIHQICGLYNTRQDKENKSVYSCPLCLLEKRKKKGDPKILPLPPSAVDIPRTLLSDYLEKDVHKKVDGQLKELAKEKAAAENITYDTAFKALSSGGPVTIRQVTSTDRKLEVREKMKARYAHKNYPEEFPYRCKCIVVFQNIGGVDVVLFALYVYEHGEDNPEPNKRTVYVSYLDSVHFMKPRNMRTLIYHEILISYLDYARKRGFAQAFIWACPPFKGDDYIFYAKPGDQKTPKDARLRQWYLDMLVECQKRNIVGLVSNMYDQYVANKKLDAAEVPYFEGDYFPGEAENIIKTLEEAGDKRGSKKKKDSAKSSSKTKSSRSNSSDGADAEVEKCFKEGGRDPVMQKFGDAIQGMKESFIVAYLNWKDAKPEHLVVPKEIMEYREKAKLLESLSPSSSTDAKNGKLPQCKKRDADGNTRSSTGDDSSDKQLDRLGRPVRVLDDDAEEIDYEFFNNRQLFLELCRGNHYQFDELRRAKHTSMMVLWHLQNREEPKFVKQCFACNREISSGVRHHCSICSEYNLCSECFKDPKANRGTCNHKLEVIKVESSSSSTSGLTEEQRRERKRNIQLHINLIEHASTCKSTTCKSQNCQKMKSYLKHGDTCQIKASGGCKICKRIWTLLRIHAQHCKSSTCPIPQCIAIRKRIRQLQQQQQLMDDRRRQQMNINNQQGGMTTT